MVLAVTINYLAVLVAALASMAIGALWYSSFVFGTLWMKWSKVSAKDIKEKQKKGRVAWSMLGQCGALLVTAFVLAHFVDYVEATSFTAGMQAGFWIWLGFVATSGLAPVLWGDKPWKLYLLDTAHELVYLLVMGGILAVWV